MLSNMPQGIRPLSSQELTIKGSLTGKGIGVPWAPLFIPASAVHHVMHAQTDLVCNGTDCVAKQSDSTKAIHRLQPDAAVCTGGSAGIRSTVQHRMFGPNNRVYTGTWLQAGHPVSVALRGLVVVQLGGQVLGRRQIVGGVLAEEANRL